MSIMAVIESEHTTTVQIYIYILFSSDKILFDMIYAFLYNLTIAGSSRELLVMNSLAY